MKGESTHSLTILATPMVFLIGSQKAALGNLTSVRFSNSPAVFSLPQKPENQLQRLSCVESAQCRQKWGSRGCSLGALDMVCGPSLPWRDPMSLPLPLKSGPMCSGKAGTRAPHFLLVALLNRKAGQVLGDQMPDSSPFSGLALLPDPHPGGFL